MEKCRNVVSGVCLSCVTDDWEQMDEPENFWLEDRKYGTFGSCLVLNRVPSSCTFGYFLLFLGQANLKWNLKATSIFKVAQNSFQNFPRLSIFGYRSSPVATTIMVARKLLDHWLTCWYNCGATIGYHSIGMTCWNDPLFHPYLLITQKRAGWPNFE